MSNRPNVQQIQTAPVPVGFAAPSGALTIGVGGTAQVLLVASECQNGFYVENPLTAADQGIATAEPLVVDLVTASAAYPGTSIKLQPGDHVLIANPPTGAVYIEAATTGHKFSAFKY